MTSATTESPNPLENKISMPSVWLERFLAKIDRKHPSGCWIWTAFRTKHGYGKYKFGSRYTSPHMAHRLCYELCFGALDPMLHLHHKCCNPPCCNPAHLEPLTPKEHVHKTPNNIAKICAEKTHCGNWHPYNAENTILTKGGKRRCRICEQEWQRKKHAKFRAANPLPPHEEQMHCWQGHPLSGENLYILKTKTGCGYQRQCRTCQKERNRLRGTPPIDNAKTRVKAKIKRGCYDFTGMETQAYELLKAAGSLIEPT